MLLKKINKDYLKKTLFKTNLTLFWREILWFFQFPGLCFFFLMTSLGSDPARPADTELSQSSESSGVRLTVVKDASAVGSAAELSAGDWTEPANLPSRSCYRLLASHNITVMSTRTGPRKR